MAMGAESDDKSAACLSYIGSYLREPPIADLLKHFKSSAESKALPPSLLR
jgi:hypothetical protein